MSTTPNILVKAAATVGIPCSFIDPDKTFLELKFPKKRHFVINSHLGLISNSEDKVTLDKGFQYHLLKDKLPLPTTGSYLDPHSPYTEYANFKTYEEIAQDIRTHFSFPLILKKNRGSQGENVFKVNSEDEILDKIKAIFNQSSHSYDYVLLAQEYIAPKNEFRVVFYDNKVFIAYLKDIGQASYTNNLSPLHWDNARATPVNESQFAQLEAFTKDFLQLWPIPYAGLDILEDKNGKLWLIEVNSAPGFSSYVRDNGEEAVLEMFKAILSNLKKQYAK